MCLKPDFWGKKKKKFHINLTAGHLYSEETSNYGFRLAQITPLRPLRGGGRRAAIPPPQDTLPAAAHLSPVVVWSSRSWSFTSSRFSCVPIITDTTTPALPLPPRPGQALRSPGSAQRLRRGPRRWLCQGTAPKRRGAPARPRSIGCRRRHSRPRRERGSPLRETETRASGGAGSQKNVQNQLSRREKPAPAHGGDITPQPSLRF